MTRGQHLIHEIHDELDWTASEIGRVQAEIIEANIAGQPGIAHPGGLAHLYALLNRAAQRMTRLTRVYEIGCSGFAVDEIKLRLAHFLFRAGDHYELIPGASPALQKLAESLHLYFNGGLGDETDQMIRDAWMDLEGVFSALGRDG